MGNQTSDGVNYNIAFFGSKNCGKSSLINKLLNSSKEVFPTKNPTITKLPEYKYENRKLAINIWDLPGLEIYPLALQYLEGIDGAFLCFDTTSKRSFQSIKSFIKDFKDQYEIDKISFVLIGCKSDMIAQRENSIRDVHTYSVKENILYADTSSKKDDCKEILNLLISLIDNKRRATI